MAPQTPHLQAVAGWQWEAGGEDRKREKRQAGAGNANRRPRAQPVIYTALCICVRTDRPPLCANILTHGVNVRLSTADSEMFWRGGQGSAEGTV